MLSRLAGTLALLTLVSSCDDVDYVEIAPSEVIFKQANNDKQMEARCMSRTGYRAAKARVVWSSADPAIATIDGKGLAKPVKSGNTELIAKYGKIEARVPVKVIFVERIEVEPKVLTLKEGDPSASFTIKAFSGDGQELKDRQPSLVSQNKTVAQIVAGGAVLPLDPGTANIDVQVDGVKASVQIIVEADKAKKK